MKRHSPLWLALVFIMSWAFTANAQDDLDAKLQSFWGDPKVKLVAIDFYSEWCEPCRAAVPKWIELQKKYHNQGLRVVVVSYFDDKQQACSNAQWHPDDKLCDKDETISKKWGVGLLPTFFILRKSGEILLRDSDIGKAEITLASFFDGTLSPPSLGPAGPRRVFIGKPTDAYGRTMEGQDAVDLREEIREIFIKSGKGQNLTVVANEQESSELAALNQIFNSPVYSDSSKKGCELGQAQAADSYVKIFMTGGREGEKLRLILFSIRDRCPLATGSAQVKNGRLRNAAQLATYDLLKMNPQNLSPELVWQSVYDESKDRSLPKMDRILTLKRYIKEKPQSKLEARAKFFIKALEKEVEPADVEAYYDKAQEIKDYNGFNADGYVLGFYRYKTTKNYYMEFSRYIEKETFILAPLGGVMVMYGVVLLPLGGSQYAWYVKNRDSHSSYTQRESKKRRKEGVGFLTAGGVLTGIGVCLLAGYGYVHESMKPFLPKKTKKAALEKQTGPALTDFSPVVSREMKGLAFSISW